MLWAGGPCFRYYALGGFGFELQVDYATRTKHYQKRNLLTQPLIKLRCVLMHFRNSRENRLRRCADVAVESSVVGGCFGRKRKTQKLLEA
jgi:hypothetical protein